MELDNPTFRLIDVQTCISLDLQLKLDFQTYGLFELNLFEV